MPNWSHQCTWERNYLSFCHRLQQSHPTIDDFWKWSRSSSWLQRATQLVLTDEISTSCCLLCPWSIHIWGGYQIAYTTLSPLWDKQSQILFCTKTLHCKLWQIKSWLAQVFVHQRQELHPPSKVKSFLPINCLSYACANDLDDIVLNSVNETAWSLGQGNQSTWASPAWALSVISTHLEQLPHRSAFYTALGTALWTETKQLLTFNLS